MGESGETREGKGEDISEHRHLGHEEGPTIAVADERFPVFGLRSVTQVFQSWLKEEIGCSISLKTTDLPSITHGKTNSP